MLKWSMLSECNRAEQIPPLFSFDFVALLYSDGLFDIMEH